MSHFQLALQTSHCLISTTKTNTQLDSTAGTQDSNTQVLKTQTHSSTLLQVLKTHTHSSTLLQVLKTQTHSSTLRQVLKTQRSYNYQSHTTGSFQHSRRYFIVLISHSMNLNSVHTVILTKKFKDFARPNSFSKNFQVLENS